jgi:parvulin-like peptidyl-prolyl isomerase
VVGSWISVVIASIAGIAGAQLAGRSVVLRDKLGTICDRGHLLALVRGRGIYQTDLDRAVAESRDLSGAEQGEETNVELQLALTELIANAAAQLRARHEQIPRADVDRELNLMRSEFCDNTTWKQALRDSNLSTTSLGQILSDNLRARQYISKQIAPELDVSEDECRRFYDSHLGDFFLPERRDVSHLFLAAPPETAPEIVEAKRSAIEALSVRLAGGEDFATLAAQNSEDEATKLRGGDLGYFSADRNATRFCRGSGETGSRRY